jgi:hypothetical protein
MPPAAYKAALLKLIPNDASDAVTQAVLEKALMGGVGQGATSRLIFERDPDAMVEAMLDKYKEYDDDKTRDKQNAWIKAAPGDPDSQTLVFSKALERGDRALVQTVAAMVGNLRIPDDFKTAAASNPALFVTDVLPNLKSGNQFVELMADAEMRQLLKDGAPKEWADMVDDTPMLKLLGNVETKVKSKKLKKSAQIVGEIFDAIVGNDGIELGYQAVSEDPVRVILSGGTPKDKEMRAAKQKIVGDTFPDIPSTQCHSLLGLTETLMGAFPGLRPKIVQKTCDFIMLTKPLSSIPGKGLLDKGFGGNVFDDNGASLNRILFTGDSGINSHTWLEIDGVEFDPVMGTRGKEVGASKESDFKWLISDRLAKGGGADYIVKEDPPVVKAKANKMGFGTGYRLTQNPAKYLTTDEMKTAGIEPPKAKPTTGKKKTVKETV